MKRSTRLEEADRQVPAIRGEAQHGDGPLKLELQYALLVRQVPDGDLAIETRCRRQQPAASVKPEPCLRGKFPPPRTRGVAGVRVPP